MKNPISKLIPDFNNPGIIKKTHRIAITGLRSSGKTVFLTSLIDQIMNFESSSKFNLGVDSKTKDKEGVCIVNPRKIIKNKKGWEQFDYEDFRGSLVSETPKWPKKTKTNTQFIIDIMLSNWRLTKSRLIFYDIPGERFSDISMYSKNFEDWSLEQIDRLKTNGSNIPEVETYLKLVDTTHTYSVQKEKEILWSYKRALAALYLRCHRYLSPSTFILDSQANHFYLDRDMKKVKSGIFDDVIKKRFSGLENYEFAPLSSMSGETSRRFRKNYQRYKKEVVNKVFKTISKCDSMAVLLDMAHIFDGGPAYLDNANSFIKTLLEGLQPGKRLLHPISKIFSNGPITRIAFIASQIDRFHYDDFDKVLALLKAMVRPRAMGIKGADCRCFNVSAVKSGESQENTHKLYSVRKGISTEGAYGEEVSAVPADWPPWPSNGWDPEKMFPHGFPKFLPLMPAVKTLPPDHLGLDEVFRFLIGEYND